MFRISIRDSAFESITHHVIIRSHVVKPRLLFHTHTHTILLPVQANALLYNYRCYQQIQFIEPHTSEANDFSCYVQIVHQNVITLFFPSRAEEHPNRDRIPSISRQTGRWKHQPSDIYQLIGESATARERDVPNINQSGRSSSRTRGLRQQNQPRHCVHRRTYLLAHMVQRSAHLPRSVHVYLPLRFVSFANNNRHYAAAQAHKSWAQDTRSV